LIRRCVHRLGDTGQLPRPGLLLLLRELRRALLELRRALLQDYSISVASSLSAMIDSRWCAANSGRHSVVAEESQGAKE
jgi:hypothetical protein